MLFTPHFLISKARAPFLLACVLAYGITDSVAQEFESRDQAVPLIELFTSEGCSSCPPADRWLSALKTSEGLWDKFVPMAFHVDYWDYIGWKDPFASHEYSQRQRRYAAENSESTVYTPGVRKAGEEWKRWYFSGAPDDVSGGDVGKIKLSVNDQREFTATFSKPASSLQLNIALLGLDLSTEVRRGENRGKTLKHDFVVLGISKYSSAKYGEWQGQLPEPNSPAPAYAVAVWVTNGGSQKPIQATGGYLAASK